jgi:hypothetical protein
VVLPPKPVDIAFEAFLQALPQDYHALAFEFKGGKWGQTLEKGPVRSSPENQGCRVG